MLLFVYGTLLSGQEQHSLLEDARFIGKARTRGTLYDLGEFPALCTHEIRGNVYGELYEIDENTFAFLDEYEGYSPHNEKDSLYLRVEITCYTAQGSAVKAQAYIMPEHQLKRFLNIEIIPSGRWEQR